MALSISAMAYARWRAFGAVPCALAQQRPAAGGPRRARRPHRRIQRRRGAKKVRLYDLSAKHQLDARISAQVVELFHKGNRVASHRRMALKGGHSTVAAHMPKAHRDYAEWTPQRLIRWAQGSGEATARVVATILASRPHPQQGFRSCLGLMRLGKRDGPERLEAACRRALTIGACSYKSIDSILKHELDQTPVAPASKPIATPGHDNIRGPQYYYQPQGEYTCERAFSEQMQMPDITDLSFEERLGLLVDREMTERDNRRLKSRLQRAKLRQGARHRVRS